MNATYEQLTLFLGGVSRRAWFVILVERARDALWATSVTLLLLSLFHVIGFPVSAQTVMLVLAAVACWLLYKAATSRVDREKAAALADRVFGGQSLMTTAVECLPNERLESSSASGVVLAQANARAKEWMPRISKEIRIPARKAGAIALIPLFVALVLLSLQPSNDVNLDDIAMEPPAPLVNGGGTATEDIATLRRELIADVGADVGAASSREKSGQDAPPTDNVGAASSREKSGQDAPPTDNVGAEFLPRSGPDPGDLAGTALPGERAARNQTSAQLAVERSIALERKGMAASTSDQSDGDFRSTTATSSLFMAIALPASAPGQIHSRTTLTPIQAAYAARYLEETGNRHERTDD